MTNITESSVFTDNVRMYDTGDPVLGGVAGESNDPIIDLTNRTRYLYDHYRFRAIRLVTDSVSIGTDDIFKLINIVVGNNTTITIADVSDFAPGDILTFKVQTTAKSSGILVPKAVLFSKTGTGPFRDGDLTYGDGTNKNLYLYDGELLEIVANGDHWIIKENPLDKVSPGDDDFVRRQPRNTTVAKGDLVSRADYARVWQEAQIMGNVISDLLWLSDPFRYKGFYSSGDNTNTFRLPDMRGMSSRGLDLGRGVSTGRLNAVVGGYEPDANQEHFHFCFVNNIGDIDNGLALNENNSPEFRQGVGSDMNNDNYEYSITGGLSTPSIGKSSKQGAPEARIKTIGKTPIIYW